MDSGVEAEHSSLPQREDSQAAAEQITKHLSKETADVGFKFQLEILLLLCLQIFNLECKNFSVGFEVVAIEKLDDIVAECELNGRKFAFFLQAKYKASESEVFLRNFFSPTKKGATRKFWEKFNLRQFVTSLMTRNVQENLKRYSNHVKRYVIVTNNSIEAGDTIQEDCEEFREIFGKFTENGAKVVKFGREFEGKMQEIINVILEESNEVSEESRENSPNALDLLDKIVILSNVPSYSDLAVISNRFSQEIFNSNHSDLLPRFLREETNDFIKLEKNQRKFIHRKDFEDIIEISMLEAELTGISESFFRTLKLPVQFRKDVLEDFYDEMNMQKIIEYEALDQISVIKVYQALKGKQIKIFLLPLSMLKKSHKNFIKHAKCEGFKILLHLDCGKEWSQMVTKDDSVVIIGKIKKLSAIEVDRKFTMKKPLYEEFDDSTKEAIFERKIKIQGHPIKMSEIKSIILTHSEASINFLSNLVEKLTREKTIILGSELPKKEKFYVKREFQRVHPIEATKGSRSSKKKLKDKGLLKEFTNIIIMGDAGGGKSATCVKLANKIKKKYPHSWVDIISLGRVKGIFGEDFANKDITKVFAEDFLLNNLLICESNTKLCRNLLKIYIDSQEKAASSENSQIFLFFDGFNEISPNYRTFFLKLFTRFKEMNIRNFLTTRPESIENFQSLEDFSVIQMKSFTETQRNNFIRKYIEVNYAEDVAEDTIESIHRDILSNRKIDWKLLGTPSLLKVIIDIYSKDKKSIDLKDLGLLSRN